jgi:hypothetical protein
MIVMQSYNYKGFEVVEGFGSHSFHITFDGKLRKFTSLDQAIKAIDAYLSGGFDDD